MKMNRKEKKRKEKKGKSDTRLPFLITTPTYSNHNATLRSREVSMFMSISMSMCRSVVNRPYSTKRS